MPHNMSQAHSLFCTSHSILLMKMLLERAPVMIFAEKNKLNSDWALSKGLSCHFAALYILKALSSLLFLNCSLKLLIRMNQCVFCTYQEVTKRCRLFWLTSSAIGRVYEPKSGGGGEGRWLRDLSQWEQLCTWSHNKLWRSNFIFNLHL